VVDTDHVLIRIIGINGGAVCAGRNESIDPIRMNGSKSIECCWLICCQ